MNRNRKHARRSAHRDRLRPLLWRRRPEEVGRGQSARDAELLQDGYRWSQEECIGRIICGGWRQRVRIALAVLLAH